MSNVQQHDRRSTAEVLKQSAEDIHRLPMPSQQYTPQRTVALGEQGKNLHDNAQSNVNRIFDYGVAKIEKIEELCKVAKTALEIKRNAVNASMTAYVNALIELEAHTSELDQNLSELMVQNDAIGH